MAHRFPAAIVKVNAEENAATSEAIDAIRIALAFSIFAKHWLPAHAIPMFVRQDSNVYTNACW
jgi:hypothetical protein